MSQTAGNLPRTYPHTIAPLTALRFFAAAALFCYHIHVYFPHGDGLLSALAAKAYLGVDFFFILSGFILAHVYIPPLRDGTFTTRKFLIHRLARIYPVHFLTLLVAGVLGLCHAQGWTATTSWNGFAANIFLVHAWGSGGPFSFNVPSWSISAEWFAYLCFPVLLHFLLKTGMDRVVLFAIWLYVLCMGFIYVYLNITLGDVVTGFTMIRIMPEFVLGIALYLAGSRRPWIGPVIPAGLVLTALLCMSLYTERPDYLTVLILAGIIHVGAGSSLKPGARIHPALTYLGEISYSFYMIHVLVLYGFWRLFEIYGYAWLWIVLSFCATLALSAALYHFVERPARYAIRQWTGT
ncbi:MAG: acyltransferase family protein [Micavibrio sp.]|nr:acyltransferase family protein [Micavibrio sp.]